MKKEVTPVKKKHTYSTIPVESLDIERLVKASGQQCVAAVDVAKERFVVALGPPSVSGQVESLVEFRHPAQTRKFLDVLDALQQSGVAITLVMEPTGTYGDVLRFQSQQRGIEVRAVSAKRVHDSAAVFDGVASMHDGKSAVHIARLHAMGHSTPWPIGEDSQRAMRALLDMRRALEVSQHQQFGMMEALLARHWPELGEWMSIRSHKSALVWLAELGSCEAVASDPEQAARLLRRASFSSLSPELIEGAIASALSTLGLPMIAEEAELLSMLSKQLVSSRAQIADVEKRLRSMMVEGSPGAHMTAVVGPYTAAIVATLVDPLRYESARALEKACGLNLREKSSGAHVGRLQLTKRGPSLVRKALFLAVLRLVQFSPYVRAWYERRRAYLRDDKLAAIIAVMRKIVRALFHVARGERFDPCKLFDTRRLEIKPLVDAVMPPKRTQARSTIRTAKRTKHTERNRPAPAT